MTVVKRVLDGRPCYAFKEIWNSHRVAGSEDVVDVVTATSGVEARPTFACRLWLNILRPSVVLSSPRQAGSHKHC